MTDLWGVDEKQISPLRFASVEMTVLLVVRRRAERGFDGRFRMER